MLTQTSTSAQIVITSKQLSEILSKHFRKEIKMTPTDTALYFSSGGYDSRDYSISTITFVAQKTVKHNQDNS